MKKTLLFCSIFLMTSLSLWAQDKESCVKHLTFKDFQKEIWNFEKHPNEFVFKGKTAAIVDFYADWCGPCKKVGPILEKLAQEYDGKLKIYKVNVDEERALATAFQIRSIPALLFIPKEGQPMMQTGAMTEAQFKEIIEKKLTDKPKTE